LSPSTTIFGVSFSAIPGVRAATLSNHTLIGTGTSGTGVRVAAATPEDSSILTVGTGFFTTMQIPLLLGREIDERDRLNSPMVAVVNQAFAKRSFGDRNPLGQHLAWSIQAQTTSRSWAYPRTHSMATSREAWPPTSLSAVCTGRLGARAGDGVRVAAAGNPLNYVRAVRELVQRADQRLPLSDVKSQGAWIDQTINQEITFAHLCTAFAILALAIACVGLYGTMSYRVARRTGEIGIRMALGAQRARVAGWYFARWFSWRPSGSRSVCRQRLRRQKLVESFLFGMKPNDPVMLIGSVVTLTTTAILAGYLPARNASRIDPMIALRHE